MWVKDLSTRRVQRPGRQEWRIAGTFSGFVPPEVGIQKRTNRAGWDVEKAFVQPLQQLFPATVSAERADLTVEAGTSFCTRSRIPYLVSSSMHQEVKGKSQNVPLS